MRSASTVRRAIRVSAVRRPWAASRLSRACGPGYGQNEDRDRALGAGFDRYLVKPAEPDALLELVAEARAACQAS